MTKAVSELQFFGNEDGLSEGAELIVHLLKLVVLVALGNDSATGLEPQFAVAADEGADGDGLIERAVEANAADASAVGSAVVGLNLAYELHGPDLWRARERPRRERVHKGLDGVGTLVESTADAAHKVNDVAVILHILVEIDLHAVAIAAKVIAGEVDKHDVLGVLLRVVAQILGVSGILLGVARAAGSSRNRVNVCAAGAAIDSAVGLGRRAEDSETAHVEIEKVWRGIDASEGAVELEIVALVLLDETSGEDNLENIASEAMGYALTDIGFVLLVGEGACRLAHRVEIVGTDIGAAKGGDGFLNAGVG